jgi:mycothiol system anti-sigma-R factor
VTCREVEASLGPYLDSELDGAAAAAVAAHLETCTACAAQLERQRTLRAAIRAELPPYRAPDVLRARVLDAVREAAPRAGARRAASWRPLAVAASVVLVVAGTWKVATDRAAATLRTEEVLAAHVRSLMPGHLTDVTSTDQHTVKPWFDGRLDFSPPVVDEAAEGFPLIGGRLDYLGDRPVAALVYGRRLHRINVFVWPDRVGSGGPAHAERNGYFLEHWQRGGMTFWVVSDLNRPELEGFVGLLRRADTARVAR